MTVPVAADRCRDAPTDRDTPRAHSPLRPPATRASASVQNHRSPFAVSMRVFAYDAPTGTW